ncbi:hypothetical protein [Paraburkholderia caribensis]|uniref:hypothetical protein n=1 Tax=Paraburkholderia caribensis TaxID=75105 RepID=UPI001D063B06|nr:hypothetical protein [Paraburkholderia caribensis]
MRTRRDVVMRLVALGLFYPLFACGNGDKKMGLFVKNKVVLDVVLFNYRDRAVFDVLLNGSDIGVAGPYGGGAGVMTGVTVPLGPQTLTWRWADSGETVVVANALSLSADQLSSKDHYLGVHIYPGDTAELTLSQYLPGMTPKGEPIYKEGHLHGR